MMDLMGHGGGKYGSKGGTGKSEVTVDACQTRGGTTADTVSADKTAPGGPEVERETMIQEEEYPQTEGCKRVSNRGRPGETG